VCPQCAPQSASVYLGVYGSARGSVRNLYDFMGFYGNLRENRRKHQSFYFNLFEFILRKVSLFNHILPPEG
jgi:hypothetical protein